MTETPFAGSGIRPILFTFRGIRVPSYPALMYIGMVLGIAATNVAANSMGLNAARVYVATLLLIPIGLIGARLLFVGLHWEDFRGRLTMIWRRGASGSAVFGGIVLVIVVSVPLLVILGIPHAAFWDVASFTFLFGAMFTRVGCLLNGCCGGRASDSRFTLSLPDELGVWKKRFPAQLFASFWAGILVFPASLLLSRQPFTGAVFLFTLGAYSLGRVALENIRVTEVNPINPVQKLHRLSQLLLAAVPIIVLVALW
jgi:prolipoprotein diacylglyceryltransferase